jgi:hypothetical protein
MAKEITLKELIVSIHKEQPKLNGKEMAQLIAEKYPEVFTAFMNATILNEKATARKEAVALQPSRKGTGKTLLESKGKSAEETRDKLLESLKRVNAHKESKN